jgi:hypothetical protein
MLVSCGAVLCSGLGSAADGTIFRVEVSGFGFKHIVAGDANAMDARRGFFLRGAVTVRVVLAALVLYVVGVAVVTHWATVSSCDTFVARARLDVVC